MKAAEALKLWAKQTYYRHSPLPPAVCVDACDTVGLFICDRQPYLNISKAENGRTHLQHPSSSSGCGVFGEERARLAFLFVELQQSL